MGIFGDVGNFIQDQVFGGRGGSPVTAGLHHPQLMWQLDPPHQIADQHHTPSQYAQNREWPTGVICRNSLAQGCHSGVDFGSGDQRADHGSLYGGASVK